MDILYSNYARYESLYRMTMKTFGSTPIANPMSGTVIDLYIDINSMVKPLYDANMKHANPNALASSLLNLAAHLRHYFLSRHGTWTMIYLIWASNFPETSNAGYNSANRLKAEVLEGLTENINSAFNLMEILCPYIPDVYFYREVNYGVETGVVIGRRIFESGDHYNVVYTKDSWNYQLPANLQWTFLYRPKKTVNRDNLNGDISFPVYKSNLYEMYRLMELKNKPFELKREPISPALISLIWSYAGLKSRRLKSYTSFKSTYQYVEKLVYDGTIMNGMNSLSSLSHVNGINEDIIKRFAMIDFNTNLNSYLSKPTNIDRFIVNLKDPQAVRQINDEYFRQYPLDLQNF